MDKFLWLAIGAFVGYWYANQQAAQAAGLKPSPIQLPGGFTINPPPAQPGFSPGYNQTPPFIGIPQPQPGMPYVN